MIRRPPRSTLFPYTTLFRSTDPNFARSVILIAEHTEEGAMGLVLNRPAETTVAEAVPDLTWLVPGIANVFVGGPVAETAVRSEGHTSELLSRQYLVCRLLLE